MLFPPPSPLSGDNWAGLRVGILGGSFNPAHAGHVHISLQALHRLNLHCVWWMVSPQNPLKPAKGMASFARRLSEACKTAAPHPKIIVTDIESQLGTRYTADTLEKLRNRFSRTRFVWLMGTDNLAHFHLWEKWESIFMTTPVCAIARPPLGAKLVQWPVVQRFRSCLIDEKRAARLAFSRPPVWSVLHTPLNNLSATKIRAARAKNKPQPDNN